MDKSIKYLQDKYRLYKRAWIYALNPHDEQKLSDKEMRLLLKKKGMMVRNVYDFDCAVETSFWYIIKDAPFVFEELSKKYQKNVLRALERCEVKRINPVLCFDDVYDVYKSAMNSYMNADNELSKIDLLANITQDGLEYWGAYNRLTGVLVGWMSCRNNGEWTETVTAKYHPELQSFARPSDAIHFTILNYYLNELGQKYISSGSRNINHKTNAQEYKIKNWKFRKAYCNLHIVYKPEINIIIRLLYPFRKILHYFDNITLVHQVCSLLKLEEISRDCKKNQQINV